MRVSFVIVETWYYFRDYRTCSAESLPSNPEFPLLFSPFTRVKDEATRIRLDPTETGIAT